VRRVTSASTRDPFFLARRPSASCLTCARRAQGAARAACRGLPIRPASAAAGAVRLSTSSARRPSRPSSPPPSRPHLRRPSSSLLLVAAARHLAADGCCGRLLRPSAGCCGPFPLLGAPSVCCGRGVCGCSVLVAVRLGLLLLCSGSPPLPAAAPFW